MVKEKQNISEDAEEAGEEEEEEEKRRGRREEEEEEEKEVKGGWGKGHEGERKGENV